MAADRAVMWTGSGFDCFGQSDYTQSDNSKLDFIKNKPVLSTVAISGSYLDLTNKPTIPTGSVTSVGVISTDLSISGSPVTTSGSFTLNLNTSGVSSGTYNSVIVNNKGIVTGGTNMSITNNPARTIVTVAAAANGWQPTGGATRNYEVNYSVNISATSAIIAGSSSVTVVLETALTNSPNAGDWTIIGKMSNAQTVSLAITLQIIQPLMRNITRKIPAGSWVRLRSIITGTGSAVYDSGQEILL